MMMQATLLVLSCLIASSVQLTCYQCINMVYTSDSQWSPGGVVAGSNANCDQTTAGYYSTETCTANSGTKVAFCGWARTTTKWTTSAGLKLGVDGVSRGCAYWDTAVAPYDANAAQCSPFTMTDANALQTGGTGSTITAASGVGCHCSTDNCNGVGQAIPDGSPAMFASISLIFACLIAIKTLL